MVRESRRLILAQSAFERGLYSEATRHAKEAHRISLDIKIPTLEAKVSFILAKVQTGLDNPKAALSLLKSARKILQENDPEQYQIAVHLAMALTLFQLRQEQTGQNIIKSVTPYIYKVPVARQLLTNLYWLARCQHFSGLVEQAMNTTQEAIRLSKKCDMLGWSVQFHSLLSNLSDNPKHHDAWIQIFNQRTQEWPETERRLMLDHLELCTISKRASCPIDPWKITRCIKII